MLKLLEVSTKFCYFSWHKQRDASPALLHASCRCKWY